MNLGRSEYSWHTDYDLDRQRISLSSCLTLLSALKRVYQSETGPELQSYPTWITEAPECRHLATKTETTEIKVSLQSESGLQYVWSTAQPIMLISAGNQHEIRMETYFVLQDDACENCKYVVDIERPKERTEGVLPKRAVWGNADRKNIKSTYINQR